MHNTLCVVVIVVGRICDILLLYCSKPLGFHYFYDLNLNRQGEHHFRALTAIIFVEKYLNERLDLYTEYFLLKRIVC